MWPGLRRSVWLPPTVNDPLLLGSSTIQSYHEVGSTLTDRPGNRGTVFKVVPNKIQFVTSLSLFTFDITDPAWVL